MLPIEISDTFLNTTQLVMVLWLYDKATRKVLERIKERRFKCYINGLRIHHWIIGILIFLAGLLILFVENMVVFLQETGLMGLPAKISSGTVTIGFRIFIDDLKDFKKQLKSLFFKK